MERLFGEKRTIILPILLDIANLMRNATNGQQFDGKQKRPQSIDRRKYETMIKHRHRRAIDQRHRIVELQKQSHWQSVSKSNHTYANVDYDDVGENKSRHRKSIDFGVLDQRTRENETAVNDTANELDGFDMHGSGNAGLDDNLVHVTLPLLANRTVTLDEYEDLALNDLNVTEMTPLVGNDNVNETLPEPAMLLGTRQRIPIRRAPVAAPEPSASYTGTRNCELFGNLCVRVEDYPM